MPAVFAAHKSYFPAHGAALITAIAPTDRSTVGTAVSPTVRPTVWSAFIAAIHAAIFAAVQTAFKAAYFSAHCTPHVESAHQCAQRGAFEVSHHNCANNKWTDKSAV